MLQSDPRDRLTAAEALKHKWFEEDNQEYLRSFSTLRSYSTCSVDEKYNKYINNMKYY